MIMLTENLLVVVSVLGNLLEGNLLKVVNRKPIWGCY